MEGLPLVLTHLRYPESADTDTLEALQEALRRRDQAANKAAIDGLVRIGGTTACLAIVVRILDTWGMAAIERGVSALPKLAAHGGLLGLTATLLVDSRFVNDKLTALAGFCRLRQGVPGESWATSIDTPISHWGIPRELPARLDLLSRSSIEDVRYGTVLARRLKHLPEWVTDAGSPSNELQLEAAAYAEGRLPGLVALIEACSAFDW
jgi:hypothetical protein